MRIFIALMLLSTCLCSFSQTATVSCQFYLDANNNCIYDPTESILVLESTSCSLKYMNNGSNPATSIFGSVSGGCTQTATLPVVNYTLPATNTISISGFPQVILNNSCSSCYNLPYNGTTVYVPLKKINGITSVNYIAGNVTLQGSNNPNGLEMYDTFPVCSSIGNDTVQFNAGYYANLSCNFIGTTTRTFSVFLDGIQYDKISTNGAALAFNYVSGINNMCKVSEVYNSAGGYWKFSTRFPSGISALGSHTFAIKSSSIYPHPLSVFNYSCILNSFPCTKISGKFYDDCNFNCIYDNNESGLGFGVQGKVYNSSGVNTTFNPNNNGGFSLFLNSSNSYSITHYPLYSSFTACATSTLTIPSGASTNTISYAYNHQNSFQNNSHLIHPYGNNGLRLPGTNIQFGYKNFYHEIACNGSTTIVSGIQKIKLDKFLSYVLTTSGPPPSTIIPAPTGDTLVWITNNFSTLSSGSFSLAISPTVSLLTPFRIKGYIYPSPDNIQIDNVSVGGGTIGTPYDPNSKELFTSGLSFNGDIDFQNGQELQYTVHFQNVGTAPAVNVKTLDTIDINLDLNSIKILASSHPVSMQIDHVSRLVTFAFDSIYLPAAINNPIGSNGHFSYSINLNNGLLPNTLIKNRAHNYFDFTTPVATNQTKNKLVVATSLNENTFKEKEISIIPNPFNEVLNIKSSQVIVNIKIYNMMGQLEFEKGTESHDLEIDLATLPSSIYIASISLENGTILVKKIIKN